MQELKLIGDLSAIATISEKASINWLKFKNDLIFFDYKTSPEDGFHLEENHYQVTSKYITDTAILRSNIKLSSNKICTIEDFMLPEEAKEKSINHILIRRISSNSTHTLKLLYLPNKGFDITNAEIETNEHRITIREAGDFITLCMPKHTEISTYKRGFHLTLQVSTHQSYYFSIIHSIDNKCTALPDGASMYFRTKQYWEELFKHKSDLDKIAKREMINKMLLKRII